MKISKTIEFEIPYAEGQHLWKMDKYRLEVHELIALGWRMKAQYTYIGKEESELNQLLILCERNDKSMYEIPIEGFDFIFAEKNKAYAALKEELLKTLRWTIDIFGEGHERINSPTCLKYFQEAQESYKNIDGNPYFDEPGNIDRKVVMAVERFVKSAENIASQLNIMKPRYEEKQEIVDPFVSGPTA